MNAKGFSIFFSSLFLCEWQTVLEESFSIFRFVCFWSFSGKRQLYGCKWIVQNRVNKKSHSWTNLRYQSCARKMIALMIMKWNEMLFFSRWRLHHLKSNNNNRSSSKQIHIDSPHSFQSNAFFYEALTPKKKKKIQITNCTC